MTKWISTKDKMPDEDTTVLIFVPSTLSCVPDIECIDFAGVTNTDRRREKYPWVKDKYIWFSNSNTTATGLKVSYSEKEVTHWMPVPELPIKIKGVDHEKEK